MDFIKGVHNILSDKGTFVFELPYWLKTVNTQKFDQIYHEHITYFTVLMAFNVLKKNNFQIKKITQNNYHGGSIRVFSQKSLQPKLNDKISRYIKLEKEKGLFKIKTYKIIQE